MTKIGFLFAAVVAISGCSKSSDSSSSTSGGGGGGSSEATEPAYQGTPECMESVGKAMDAQAAARKAQLEQREAQGNVTPEQKERFEKGLERGEKMMAKMKNVMVKRCTEDKWPADTLDCMKTVQKREDLKVCLDKLPADMKAKAQTELGQMVRRPGMPPGGMPMGSNFQHPATMQTVTGSGAAPATGSGAAPVAPKTGSAASATTPAMTTPPSTTMSKTAGSAAK